MTLDLSEQPSEVDDLDAPLCPVCSAPLLLRTGGDGVFWGCRDFPKCKGTRRFDHPANVKPPARAPGTGRR